MPRSIPVMQSRWASRRSWWRALLCAALALQLCSCGTLLYPNRHGQARAGQMDPVVDSARLRLAARGGAAQAA